MFICWSLVTCGCPSRVLAWITVNESSDDPLDPSSWYSAPGVCGSCIAWRPTEPDLKANVASGLCKLRPELRSVPATMVQCNIYKPRGQFRYSPDQVSAPKRRRNKVLKVVRMNEAGEMVSTPTPVARAVRERVAVSPKQTLPREIDLGEMANAPLVRKAFSTLIQSELGLQAPQIHAKFSGGKLEVIDSDGKPRFFPVELLFAHLVRFQDSLENLSGQVDRYSTKLGDKTAIELTDYLKRIQGTMTTFNVLFQNKTDFFSSK